MKFFLLNLPLNYRQSSYFPLSSAYLCSYIKNKKTTYRVEIVPVFDSQGLLLNDYQILNYIAENKPLVLGISCYLWNIERCIRIAKLIKNVNSNIIIVAGGPEISLDNNLISGDFFDYIIIGEGETPFYELCANITATPYSIPEIMGVARKNESNEWTLSSPAKNIDDINNIPSPHLSGVLDNYNAADPLLETARGCIYKCHYCHYYKNENGVRYFSLDRIKDELTYYSKRNAQNIYFLDPTFSSSNRLEQIADLILKYDFSRKISFHCELRAEHITPQRAKLLKKAGVNSAEIGLQSANEKALRNVGRSLDKNKFINGITYLNQNGIKTHIDLIMGLPGDNDNGYTKTKTFIKNFSRKKNVSFDLFPLSILPGTKLRDNHNNFKIKYMLKPPYFVIKNNNSSFKNIYKHFDYFRKNLPGESYFHLNILNYPFFQKYEGYEDPIQSNSHITSSQRGLILNFNNQISQNIPLKTIDFLNKTYKKYLQNKFTIIIKGCIKKDNALQINKLTRSLIKHNPLCRLNIILIANAYISLQTIQMLTKSVQLSSNYINRYIYYLSGKINLLNKTKLPPEVSLICANPKEYEYNDETATMTASFISCDFNRIKEFIEKTNYKAYYISMDENMSACDVLDTIAYCRKTVSLTGKYIYFNDWKHWRLFTGEYQLLDIPSDPGILVYNHGKGLSRYINDKKKSVNEFGKFLIKYI